MRILIVTQYFWPENFRINDLAQGLMNRGHEVTVYTGKPNYPEGRFFPGYGFLGHGNETFGGVRVIRVPLLPRGEGSGFRLALNYLSFAFFASFLAPFRVYGDFDVILVYEPSPVTVGLPALILKALKGAPVLFWVQDLWPESLVAADAVRARWILAGIERLVRFIYHRCDRILVQSKAFVEAILPYGIPREQILFFPNTAEALYRPVALEPDAFEAHYNLGNIFHDLGRYPEAQARYREALRLNPTYPDAHFYLAVTLEKSGQSSEARPHWRAYQQLAPNGEWVDLAKEFSD